MTDRIKNDSVNLTLSPIHLILTDAHPLRLPPRQFPILKTTASKLYTPAPWSVNNEGGNHGTTCIDSILAPGPCGQCRPRRHHGPLHGHSVPPGRPPPPAQRADRVGRPSSPSSRDCSGEPGACTSHNRSKDL